ncbi:MAG: hypothetical protein K1X88_14690 [Nannocystaceae bacterium]|nr:hypothetical protein [Nannocystaceae bacterium]
MPWSRRALLLLVAPLAGCDPPGPQDTAVSLVLPRDGDETTTQLGEELAAYLERIVGEQVPVTHTDEHDLAAAVRATGTELVVVLDAPLLDPDRIDDARLAALGDSGFVLEVDGEDDQRAVAWLGGATPLSRRYAAYELLRRLGVRFWHPEDEFVPELPREAIARRARTPTIVQRGRDGDPVPDFAWRSWSFHSQHPLEHLEAFSDGGFPIDEAEHVNTWMVKNFGNRFRGAGRGVAGPGATAQRQDELEAMRTSLGFARGAGITLHNQQQGASAQIDPTSDVPVQHQIETLVASQLAATPDARWFGIHFGPTEFTTTPDQETVQWIDWAAQAALAIDPSLEIEINNHITGSQPSPHYDDLGCPNGTNDQGRIDYYDLAFHSDARAGISVHTAMFYPLEGPARVYAQQSFAHKLCLMQQASAAGRPLTWFPEGAWWLAFDNAVPVFLPLYVQTRLRDLELLRPLLPRNGGTLRGHRMFDTGQEWGYWQQDYAVGLASWNADLDATAIWHDMLAPMCGPEDDEAGSCAARDEAVAIVTELAAHQAELFLTRVDARGRPGGLYTYFAGEDPADAIAADAGLEFRPVRPSLGSVARYDADELAALRDVDLAALAESLAVHQALEQRAATLLFADMPPGGFHVFAEIADGVMIDRVRADQALHLYRAVAAWRQAQLDGATPEAAVAAADADLAEAARALDEAAAIIARREVSYRYAPAQTMGGGVTPETAVANGTTYPYRVFTKTHLLSYWHDRDDEARRVIAGEDTGAATGVQMREGIDATGVPLSITWPALEGLGGTVAVGSLGEVGPPTESFDTGSAEGFFAIAGELDSTGGVVPVRGAIARAGVLARTPAKGVTLLEPSSSTAQGVLQSVFPALAWARVDGAATLAFAPDGDGDGSTLAAEVVGVGYEVTATGFTTAAVDFVLPIQLASGNAMTQIDVRGAVISASMELGDPITMSGALELSDLVDALVQLAGFDPEGSLSTLGGIFGFDPDDPPETVPFVAELDALPW